MSENSWIGVDLDRTLAKYDSWEKGNIGDPIDAMHDRVEKWLAAGIEVRIVTARANRRGYESNVEWAKAIIEISDWAYLCFGERLEVTCEKDYQMIELWDDRAVRVEPNTGKALSESLDYEVKT